MDSNQVTQPIDLFAQLDEVLDWTIGCYEERFLQQKWYVNQVRINVKKLLSQLTAYEQPEIEIDDFDRDKVVYLHWKKPGYGMRVSVLVDRVEIKFTPANDINRATGEDLGMSPILTFLDQHFKLE